MIHAIIDIGSNTVRMAVYQIKDSAVEQIMKKKDTTVGLASFMHDNVLEERGIKRLVYALEDFQKFLAALHIENVSIFTTGALRNAANSREAIAEIKTRTGLDIYVIRGEEEAELDFIGATHDLAAEEGLLFDIGGASTEMVHYKAQKIVRKTSLPVGSLYLHTKFTKELLPSREEVAKMRTDATRILDSAADFTGLQGLPACGIGGTFKGAAALSAALFSASDGRTITRAAIDALLARFLRDRHLTEDDAVHLMRTVPDRMHTLLPGLVIAGLLTERFALSFIAYSDSGVREGYIYDRILKESSRRTI